MLNLVWDLYGKYCATERKHPPEHQQVEEGTTKGTYYTLELMLNTPPSSQGRKEEEEIDLVLSWSS